MESTTAQPSAIVAFATLGVLSTTQAIAGRMLESVEGADPELVAEETLALVATATARAAEVALRDAPSAAAQVVPVLLDLPFTYHDYLVGGAMMEQPEAPELLDAHEAVLTRLQRKMAFYTVHLPPGKFPGLRALRDKMGLWMGRISPPRLPESPTDRLERLDLIPVLETHLRLVLAYSRHTGSSPA